MNTELIKNFITVKQLWIRFPADFTKSKCTEFYESLGDNLPQYCEFDGRGIQINYCVNKNTNVDKICRKFNITEYSTCEFITEESKFNNNHKIYSNFKTWGVVDAQPYILEKIND